MEQIDVIKEWFKEYPLIWNIAKFILSEIQDSRLNVEVQEPV